MSLAEVLCTELYSWVSLLCLLCIQSTIQLYTAGYLCSACCVFKALSSSTQLGISALPAVYSKHYQLYTPGYLCPACCVFKALCVSKPFLCMSRVYRRVQGLYLQGRMGSFTGLLLVNCSGA